MIASTYVLNVRSGRFHHSSGCLPFVESLGI